jgi:hypothetical protein
LKVSTKLLESFTHTRRFPNKNTKHKSRLHNG